MLIINIKLEYNKGVMFELLVQECYSVPWYREQHQGMRL